MNLRCKDSKLIVFRVANAFIRDNIWKCVQNLLYLHPENLFKIGNHLIYQ